MKTCLPDEKNCQSIPALISSATLIELNYILKNVKRGKNYLVALIGNQGFYELLKQGKKTQDTALYADLEEKSGNALRMLTTVFTSALGAWLGMEDFLSSDHRSLQQLALVTLLSVVSGIAVGVLSYRFAANRAKEAVLQKKLANLQMDLTKKMVEIIENKIQTTKDKLQCQLGKLTNDSIAHDLTSFFNMEDKKPLPQKEKTVLLALRKKIEEKLNVVASINPLLDYVLHINFKTIDRIITAYIKLTDECHATFSKNPIKNDIKLLSQPITQVSGASLTVYSWLMNSSMGIFLEAVPVFMGTFAAIFLFLNGLPDILKKLGYAGSLAQFNQPWIKYTSLVVAFSFVLYLGVSQVKFTYKSYFRSKSMEDVQSKIAKNELKYFSLCHQYTLIKKFSGAMRKLVKIIKLSNIPPSPQAARF
jgi:hypothetical protein